ncbi:hypothetical protein EsH8_IV_001250 [Colletotrichum jinshuiense]
MATPFPPGSSSLPSSPELLSSASEDDDEEEEEEEEEPEIKEELVIAIDATNRDRWRDIVLRARRHMRCHHHHWGRRPERSWQTCILSEDSPSSSDEGDGAHDPPPPVSEPEPPTFHLFMGLPKELRDEILLASVDPIVVKGWVKIDLEWRRGPQAHFSSSHSRRWSAIPLFGVSREIRAVATAFFGAPDPRGFPFSPARDSVVLEWDGSMVPTTWRAEGNYREAGPVVTASITGGPNKEWAMPRSLCERIQHAVVDGRYGYFDGGPKGAWHLVFEILKGFFPELKVLEVKLWDLDDERFEGAYDPAAEELYRVDQLDFFDRLEEMSEDGRVPFPKLRSIKIVPKLPLRRQTRERFRFRQVNGGHFVVVRKGEIPTAGP